MDVKIALEARVEPKNLNGLTAIFHLIFSRDHTLKVFLTDVNLLHFTLHGHTAPISAILIDRFQQNTAYSGSQDGFLFVWDFMTGKSFFATIKNTN